MVDQKEIRCRPHQLGHQRNGSGDRGPGARDHHLPCGGIYPSHFGFLLRFLVPDPRPLLLRPGAGHSNDSIVSDLFQRDDLFPSKMRPKELAEPGRGGGVGVFFVGQVDSGEAPRSGKVEVNSLSPLMNLEDHAPGLGLIDFLNHPTPQGMSDFRKDLPDLSGAERHPLTLFQPLC